MAVLPTPISLSSFAASYADFASFYVVIQLTQLLSFWRLCDAPNGRKVDVATRKGTTEGGRSGFGRF